VKDEPHQRRDVPLMFDFAMEQRARIAQKCEDHGILAVLVAAQLRAEGGSVDEFIRAMKGILAEGRRR